MSESKVKEKKRAEEEKIDLGTPIAPSVVWQHPTGKVPESVFLVGLGPTKAEYSNYMVSHSAVLRPDEVWTVNTGMRCFDHDVAFIMDDLGHMSSLCWQSNYGNDLANAKKPIITSVKYDQFPSSIAYPINEVVKAFIDVLDEDDFHTHCSSVPYVFAYALYIGVKTLHVYGVDYDFAGVDRVEDGKDETSFWVGYCRGKGMNVIIHAKSTLLGSSGRGERRQHGKNFYGYLKPPLYFQYKQPT
jgi:hypothetical protein